jgi:hypothetical protein
MSEQPADQHDQQPKPAPPALVPESAPPVLVENAPPPAGGLNMTPTTGCLIGVGIMAVSLVAAALLIAFAIRDSANRAAESVDRMNPANVLATLAPPPTPTIVVRPPAILSVRALSDLATAQMLMSTVVEADQARVGNIVYEKLVLIACGRVKAGIALNELKDSDVTESADGKTVTVRLPRAKMLDSYLIDDPNQPCTTKVYDRTNLIVLPETKELESQAREKALEAIRQTAEESGLMSEARRNAQIAIERILLNAGYDKVEFVEE